MGNRSSKKSVEDEVKEALQRNDEALAAAKIQEYLGTEENIPLNIAVTGESGSGKSTFVNAIRGVDNRDEKAAPTGSVETTMEVTPYPYPNFPNITVWDLPGVGTMKFRAAEYLKKVGFERFDFFIIISADRFTEHDAKLAKEIRRMKKKFFFVRSKIDNNIRDETRCQREQLCTERALSKIRKNCIKGVPLEELIKVIISPLAATVITPALVVKTLVQTVRLPALLAAEEGSRFIPILGIPVSMALSFTMTYKSLNILLDMLAEDAQNVLKAART